MTDAATRETNRALLQPLVNAGVGTSDPLNLSVAELSQLLRGSVANLTPLDPLMSNLLTSTAGVLETLNNRVRRLWDENAEPPEEPEGEASPQEAEGGAQPEEPLP